MASKRKLVGLALLACFSSAAGVDAAPTARRMRRETRQQALSLIEVDEAGDPKKTDEQLELTKSKS